MRLTEITIKDYPPVRHFHVDNLSDVVVIAGPNGVGKTRVLEALLAYFQRRAGETVHISLEATSQFERDLWNKNSLDSSDPNDMQLLQTTLEKNRRRRNFHSSIVYFESNRAIQKVQPLTFSWDFPDPWEENVSWNMTLTGLQKRFQDTLHSIFRKIQNQRNSIAIKAQQLRKEGYPTMNLSFEDPLDPFRKVFSRLLGPKKLLDADLQSQTLTYATGGTKLKIQSLSSGEREVLNIAFDFLLRNPSDCIVLFDEPELHLHPELSSKLLGTLMAIGERNQFIFCTHSPEIISTSLENTVICLTPESNGSNQAIVVKPDDDTQLALRSLGQSIGIVSLGKKIVLIEGDHASLDKQTYGEILRHNYPNLVLVPCAGKHTITSFRSILSDVLDKTLWGVEFFMLCDRDAVPSTVNSEQQSSDTHARLKVLPRYHLENYFLNEHVLAKVFSDMEQPQSWLTSPDAIKEKIREIGRSKISYATSLIVAHGLRQKAGNLSVMPRECHDRDLSALKELFGRKVHDELERVSRVADSCAIQDQLENTFNRLSKSVEEDDDLWLAEIPGKQLFTMFCSMAKIVPGRLKRLYVRRAFEVEQNPFEDIFAIFQHFSTA